MWLASWMIIVLVLIGILIILIRSSDSIYILSYIKDRLFYIILILIFVFFAISLTHIHSTYNLDLTTGEGIGKALGIYWSWIVNVGKNIGKVTGYAIQQDWFSANSTNSTPPK